MTKVAIPECFAPQLRNMLRMAARRPNDGTQMPAPVVVWDTDARLEPERPTRVLISLDIGAHASGWWRNSEYDRCWHASISHPVFEEDTWRQPLRIEAPSDDELRAWAKLIWPMDFEKTWMEPPASALSIDVIYHLRRPGVGHLRLFLDKEWHPIQPTGEVYDLKPWSDGTSPDEAYH